MIDHQRDHASGTSNHGGIMDGCLGTRVMELGAAALDTGNVSLTTVMDHSNRCQLAFAWHHVDSGDARSTEYIVKTTLTTAVLESKIFEIEYAPHQPQKPSSMANRPKSHSGVTIDNIAPGGFGMDDLCMSPGGRPRSSMFIDAGDRPSGVPFVVA